MDLEHIILDSKEMLKRKKDVTRMQELALKGQFWDNLSKEISTVINFNPLKIIVIHEP